MQQLTNPAFAGTGFLPNFIIIGAQKSGTTALFRYLRAHPEICMSADKEPNYFCQNGFGANFDKGPVWYRSLFQSDAKAIGEASPTYTTYPHIPGVPQRMHDLLPDAKLIYIVRDPVERTLSHWLHNRSSPSVQETRSLSECLSSCENSYVARSKYHMQIEQYLQFYDMDRILILEQTDLLRNRLSALSRVFRFLDVDDKFVSEAFTEKHNITSHRLGLNKIGKAISAMPGKVWIAKHLPGVTAVGDKLLWRACAERKPNLNSMLKQRLCEHLAEDAQRFRALTGLKLESWSV